MTRLRFVVGRVEHRLLRGPAVNGWIGEEGGASRRGSYALSRISGGGALLAVPSAPGVVLSAAAMSALEGNLVTAMIAWPELTVIVRHAGVVVHGEGDIVHFGDLALDGLRVLRRVGFEYLHAAGADVSVEMQLEERSAVDASRALRRSGFDTVAQRTGPAPVTTAPREASVLDTVRMIPGDSARFGPYELWLERSYDHARRPTAGESGHGYHYRLRRRSEDVVAGRGRESGFPDTLALETPEPVIAATRGAGLLDEDEALAGEPELALRLGRFEGARARLESELAAAGPVPPRLRRHGDAVVIEAARLARGPHGEALVGRAEIVLGPVGLPAVHRGDATVVPGRMRK